MNSGLDTFSNHRSVRAGRPASTIRWLKVGFPIRRSSDQSSFAAPQGLSQRTTSFIASQRQGIHQMLLRHLIALMIGVRREPQPDRLSLTPSTVTIKTGSRFFRTRCLMLAERTRAGRFRNGPGTFPLHDVRYPQPPALGVDGAKLFDPDDPSTTARWQGRVVELDGIEPTTSCLQSTRSPN